jgi:hypothetical protein
LLTKTQGKESDMKRILEAAFAVLFLGIALVFPMAGSVKSQAPKREDIRPFMQKKLKYAQILIEGLANEDFALIRDNTRELRKIAGDAQWKISPNLTYIKYSSEFATIAEELERRASEKDLNGATLSYIRLTINCVDCHKFVRDNRIFDDRKR